MITQPNDGGPAFPVAFVEEKRVMVNTPHEQLIYEGQEGHPGMSLRDWFAGQALVGLIAAESQPNGGSLITDDIPARACYAYAQADAMLDQRAKRSTS